MQTSRLVKVIGASLLMAAGAAWADLNTGLVLYYSFDQAPVGTAVVDDSGNGHSGLLLGGAQHVDGGRIGGGYLLDGVDDAIQVVSPPTANTKYSISLWFTSASSANFDENRHVVSDNRRYELGAENLDGAMRLYSFALNFADFGPAYQIDTAPLCIDPDVWHQVTLVADDAQRPAGIIYVDGKQVAAGTGDGVNLGGIQFLIGALNNGGGVPVSFWNGLVDEVRVYNRALGADEVQELYHLADAPTAKPPVVSISLGKDPKGAEDMTSFASTDVLYIRVHDVYFNGSDPNSRYVAILKRDGPKSKAPQSVELLPQADGSYLGSMALSSFGPGGIKVQVGGTTKNGDSRVFESLITVH